MNKYLIDQSLKQNRKNNFEISFKRTYKSIVNFKIPDGKSIKNIPEKVDLKYPFGSALSYYELFNGNLKHVTEIKVTSLLIESNQFSDWNKFIQELNKIYNTSIEIN